MALNKKVPAQGLFFRFFVLLFFSFFAFSCKTAPSRDEYRDIPSAQADSPVELVVPGEARVHIRDEGVFLPRGISQRTPWKNLAPGISFLEWRVSGQKIHNIALKINLLQSGLEIISYPSDVDSRGEFSAKTPRGFARETGASVVINTTPFKMPSGVLSKKRAFSGIYRVDGREFSSPVERYAALCFLPDNTARIIFSQAAQIPVDANLVIGGFFSILQAGAIVPFKATSLDARMAIGLSQDKTTLYILCVTGNGGLFPRGMTYEECALTLFRLGAVDAMQMDGGSSTSLVIDGKTFAGLFGVTPAALLGFKF